MVPSSTAVSRYSLIAIASVIWGVLFIEVVGFYPGSKPVLIAFSLVSLLMLASITRGGVGFGYIYFCIFIWLGLWFKFAANVLISGVFQFGEPVGSFDCSGGTWDAVITVALVACVGIIAGRVFAAILKTDRSADTVFPLPPHWYCSARQSLWVLICVATVAVALLNIKFGVHQIGIVPKTIFPWPGNALAAWFLNSGAAIAMCTLVAWDLSDGRNLSWRPFALLGQSFVISISVMSRSIFPLQGASQALAFLCLLPETKNQRRLQVIWFAAFLAMVVASIFAVSLMRDASYRTTTATQYTGPSISTKAGVCVQNGKTPIVPSFRKELLQQLLVNRWVGIEGIMAVEAYPQKSQELLVSMLSEYRDIGKPTAYQAISNSGYQSVDRNFEFATIPGIAAFLYMSGSLWTVFFGTAFVTLVIIFGERCILRLTSNKLICTLFGLMIANTAAQFGITPRQDLPQFGMFFLCVVFIWAIQRKCLLKKINR